MVTLVSSENIQHNIFMAMEDQERAFLPVGEQVLVDALGQEDDGIFSDLRSWKSFIMVNFNPYRGLSGEPKESFLNEWCHLLESYSHLFAVQDSVSQWARVPAEDLSFEFEYDLNNFRAGDDFPCRVEIYVTATFK